MQLGQGRRVCRRPVHPWETNGIDCPCRAPHPMYFIMNPSTPMQPSYTSVRERNFVFCITETHAASVMSSSKCACTDLGLKACTCIDLGVKAWHRLQECDIQHARQTLCTSLSINTTNEPHGCLVTTIMTAAGAAAAATIVTTTTTTTTTIILIIIVVIIIVVMTIQIRAAACHHHLTHV